MTMPAHPVDNSRQSLSIRPIAACDWPEIMAVQQQCYPQISPESLSVMQSKWHIGADFCRVAAVQTEGKVQPQLAGYALAHPYALGSAPKLEQILGRQTASALYIHDIAVAPSHHGHGIAAQLFQQLCELAQLHHCQTLHLVSLASAVNYWLKQGFTVDRSYTPGPEYGVGSRYMTKPLK